jgi:hypothetical protein
MLTKSLWKNQVIYKSFLEWLSSCKNRILFQKSNKENNKIKKTTEKFCKQSQGKAQLFFSFLVWSISSSSLQTYSLIPNSNWPIVASTHYLAIAQHFYTPNIMSMPFECRQALTAFNAPHFECFVRTSTHNLATASGQHF